MIATWTKEKDGTREGLIEFDRISYIHLKVFMQVQRDVDEVRVWVLIRPGTKRDSEGLNWPNKLKETHPTIPAEFYVTYPMNLPVDQCKMCEGSGTAPPFAGDDAKRCPACEGETVDMYGLAMRFVEDFVSGYEERWVKENGWRAQEVIPMYEMKDTEQVWQAWKCRKCGREWPDPMGRRRDVCPGCGLKEGNPRLMTFAEVMGASSFVPEMPVPETKPSVLETKKKNLETKQLLREVRCPRCGLERLGSVLSRPRQLEDGSWVPPAVFAASCPHCHEHYDLDVVANEWKRIHDEEMRSVPESKEPNIFMDGKPIGCVTLIRPIDPKEGSEFLRWFESQEKKGDVSETKEANAETKGPEGEKPVTVGEAIRPIVDLLQRMHNERKRTWDRVDAAVMVELRKMLAEGKMKEPERKASESDGCPLECEDESDCCRQLRTDLDDVREQLAEVQSVARELVYWIENRYSDEGLNMDISGLISKALFYPATGEAAKKERE